MYICKPLRLFIILACGRVKGVATKTKKVAHKTYYYSSPFYCNSCTHCLCTVCFAQKYSLSAKV